jgi:hypothetical protein
MDDTSSTRSHSHAVRVKKRLTPPSSSYTMTVDRSDHQKQLCFLPACVCVSALFPPFAPTSPDDGTAMRVLLQYLRTFHKSITPMHSWTYSNPWRAGGRSINVFHATTHACQCVRHAYDRRETVEAPGLCLYLLSFADRSCTGRSTTPNYPPVQLLLGLLASSFKGCSSIVNQCSTTTASLLKSKLF